MVKEVESLKGMNMEAVFIEEKLCQLANATRIDGEIWRAVYTKEDATAKKLVSAWMEKAGLAVYEDSVGNLFGRVKGKSDGVVLVGSHIDTVRNGGKYDGAAGIITAIAAVKELLAVHGQPGKSLEIVALAEEEGSRYGFSYLGSKAVTGKLAQKELYEKDGHGISLYEAMQKAGYYPERLEEAVRKDLESYIELHVEQGPILDKMSVQIGIVESIVGIISYEVSVRGVQNHAGTTPMNMRRDPVFMTSKLIQEMTRKVNDISDRATLTVGKLQTIPGISNVIAKEVRFSIDIRDGVNRSLTDIDSYILQSFEHLKKLGYEVCFQRQCYEMPVSLDPEIVRIIEEAANEAGKTAVRMNSGAGHDAQIFADVIPTGVIFIPSKNGISHSPEEYTAVGDLESGLIVLKSTIKKLAWDQQHNKKVTDK